jgi:hypothetical protein
MLPEIFSILIPRHLLITFWVESHRWNDTLTAFVSRLVLETLEPLPGERKCFRMINGVLVERTVKDVVPAIQTNSEGLKKVLEDLVKQYNSKQLEMEKWKVRRASEKSKVLSISSSWEIGTQKKNNIQVVQQ